MPWEENVHTRGSLLKLRLAIPVSDTDKGKEMRREDI